MPTSSAPTSPRARVVAVVNLKGGVGKTTLCVHLAYGLAFFHQKRVLVVDLDPQANATQYLISQQSYRKVYLSEKPSKLTAYELYKAANEEDGLSTMRRELSDPDKYLQRVYAGQSGYLDLLASKLELSMIAFQEGHGQQNDQIRWFLEQVSGRYDFVFIDCPPTVSRMLMAGFEASEYFLVPVKPEFLSTIGIPLLDNVLRNLYSKRLARRADYQTKDLECLGIVCTMVDSRLNMTFESIAELRLMGERLKYPIFSTQVSVSTKFAWSSRQALPIFRSEPRSKHAAEIAALVDEFLFQCAGGSQ